MINVMQITCTYVSETNRKWEIHLEVRPSHNLIYICSDTYGACTDTCVHHGATRTWYICLRWTWVWPQGNCLSKVFAYCPLT